MYNKLVINGISKITRYLWYAEAGEGMQSIYKQPITGIHIYILCACRGIFHKTIKCALMIVILHSDLLARRLFSSFFFFFLSASTQCVYNIICAPPIEGDRRNDVSAEFRRPFVPCRRCRIIAVTAPPLLLLPFRGGGPCAPRNGLLQCSETVSV